MSKKTLELTLCESEGVKIEVSCYVERIENPNPAIHPDSPNQGTITEYVCEDIIDIKFNGVYLSRQSRYFDKKIGDLVESQLESNPELFNE